MLKCNKWLVTAFYTEHDIVTYICSLVDIAVSCWARSTQPVWPKQYTASGWPWMRSQPRPAPLSTIAEEDDG